MSTTKRAPKKTPKKPKVAKALPSTSKKKTKKKKTDFKSSFFTSWTGQKTRIIELYNTKLVSALMQVCSVREDYGSQTRRWYVTENDLLTKFRRIEKMMSENEDYKDILKGINTWLQETVNERQGVFNFNQKSGFVTFQDLWLMFYEGQKVMFDDNGAFVAGEIIKAQVQNGFSGLYYLLTLKIVGHDGTKFTFRERQCAIPYFEDGERINNLPVRPVTDEAQISLSHRGAKVLQMIKKGASYVQYNGEVLVRSWWGPKRYRAQGRCMLDPKTHKYINENYERRYASTPDVADNGESSERVEEISEGDYWRISPWVPGFSFMAKQWGECNIENISEISFNTRAYDQLVLPARQMKGLNLDPKKMIRSLVEHGAIGFSDIIADKGGGIIFLLHGPPGTGKTLTAEAIADLLKRPLYSVSVGELGTDTEQLEKNLRTVLEVATLWNAVLLIDEADIFLERRTPRDIERNALVAIFLRMLEYYQGVLFLTTNRVRQFDPAFNSRISIALHYPDHDSKSRESIWINLMLAAGLDPKAFNTEKLARENVNGRQIKHALRIGLSLAANENRKPVMDDFMNTIILAQQFNEQLGESLVEDFERLETPNYSIETTTVEQAPPVKVGGPTKTNSSRKNSRNHAAA